MVSSIANSDELQQMMAQLLQKMNSADTDGIQGLSKNELESISTDAKDGSSAFLDALSSQFSELDANGDGQLSTKEVSNIKSDPMGPPPGLFIEAEESSDSSSTSSNKDTISELMEKWMDKFAESYDSAEDSENADSLVASIDKDGTNSLSYKELSQVAGDDGSIQSQAVKSLMDNFENFDKNNDSQLDKDEISQAFSDFSEKVKTSDSSDGNEFFDSLKNGFEKLSSSVVKKLIENYNNNGFSGALSALNITM